jgi:hypothetical protein
VGKVWRELSQTSDRNSRNLHAASADCWARSPSVGTVVLVWYWLSIDSRGLLSMRELVLETSTSCCGCAPFSVVSLTVTYEFLLRPMTLRVAD